MDACISINWLQLILQSTGVLDPYLMASSQPIQCRIVKSQGSRRDRTRDSSTGSLRKMQDGTVAQYEIESLGAVTNY